MIVFKKFKPQFLQTLFVQINVINIRFDFLRSWGLRFSMFVLEPLAIDPSKWLLPKLDVGMFCDC